MYETARMKASIVGRPPKIARLTSTPNWVAPPSVAPGTACSMRASVWCACTDSGSDVR